MDVDPTSQGGYGLVAPGEKPPEPTPDELRRLALLDNLKRLSVIQSLPDNFLKKPKEEKQ